MSAPPSVWGLFLPLRVSVCMHESVCFIADCKYMYPHRFAWLRLGCLYVLMAVGGAVSYVHPVSPLQQQTVWPLTPPTAHSALSQASLYSASPRVPPRRWGASALSSPCWVFFPQMLGAASRSRPDQTLPCPQYLVSSECDLHFLVYNGAVSPKRQIRPLWPGSDRQTGGRPAPEDHRLLCPVCTLGK